jgi:hypothetical protein
VGVTWNAAAVPAPAPVVSSPPWAAPSTSLPTGTVLAGDVSTTIAWDPNPPPPWGMVRGVGGSSRVAAATALLAPAGVLVGAEEEVRAVVEARGAPAPAPGGPEVTAAGGTPNTQFM